MSASNTHNPYSRISTFCSLLEKELNITDIQKIGTRFRKENIFFALCNVKKRSILNLVRKSPDLIPNLAKSLGAYITTEQFIKSVKDGEYDSLLKAPTIVYKISRGYLKFDSGEPLLITGNGSDGQAILSHITPIFNYFSEDELKEVQTDNNFWLISPDIEDEVLSLKNEQFENDIKSGKI